VGAARDGGQRADQFPRGADHASQAALSGVTSSVYRSSGTVTINNSRLVGGAVSGAVTCVAVSRSATFNANGCP
jgi:hypothetical protein